MSSHSTVLEDDRSGVSETRVDEVLLAVGLGGGLLLGLVHLVGGLLVGHRVTRLA